MEQRYEDWREDMVLEIISQRLDELYFVRNLPKWVTIGWLTRVYCYLCEEGF